MRFTQVELRRLRTLDWTPDVTIPCQMPQKAQSSDKKLVIEKHGRNLFHAYIAGCRDEAWTAESLDQALLYVGWQAGRENIKLE